MHDAIINILRSIGEDPERPGLIKTPDRVEKTYQFLTKGYKENPEKILISAIFDEPYDEMVVVKNINIYSLCEHHLLPFHGKVHVAYIPDGKIVGLSKIPRVVEAFARRLQVQERLTQQIAFCINNTLQPKGTAVVIEAYHLCLAMRGVEKQNAHLITSTLLGRFRSDRGTRQEFMSFIKQ
ncbi:MAG: GTP cyclohydrolase I FolE [Candidatus Aureabacteria bacterium]|nr:GTP cyclohydrolase I FolE [Candidatus Auribacterota bacterium]